MVLYHGSNVRIDKIDISKSKPFKDFGQGFYLSANRAQAMRMAENKANLMLDGSPIVSKFYFDENLLDSNELKILRFEDYSIEWAQFIIKNRDIHEPQPCHDYDIVYGPIADDGVVFQLRRYFAGTLTLEELVKELKFAQGITFQYFFGTDLAISKLQKI